MKFKLPALFLTLFLILVLVPAAFAQEAEVEVSDFCLDTTTYLHPEEGFQHPVGAGIAARYEVEYPLVMSWFCQGYGFGQIMLALETSKVLSSETYEGEPLTPEELLAMRSDEVGWGEIWKSLGFIGRPKSSDWTGGPPEWAGPKHSENEEGEGLGPPDWAGPPEWAGPNTEDRQPGPPPWARGPKDKLPKP